MPQETNSQPTDTSSDLKSFRMYSGKAPLLVRIVGGIIWLGAAGLLLQGVLSLLLAPIFGVLTLIMAVFAVITGKSLFGMKKTAFRNTLIFAVFFLGIALWSMFSGTSPQAELTNTLYAVLLALLAFKYKNQFAN